MAALEDLRVCGAQDVTFLSPINLFEDLTRDEKLYAHYMARAAWLGTRIILRQVSPESIPIFEFILELYRTCNGRWVELSRQTGLSEPEMGKFLAYAAVFLQNLGNFSGHGDRKFVPDLPNEVLRRLSLASPLAANLYEQLAPRITSPEPSGLGYTSTTLQTSYYVGVPMTSGEVAAVSQALERRSIGLENTRIRKQQTQGQHVYDLLQASVRPDECIAHFCEEGIGQIRLFGGDHNRELSEICGSLAQAQEYTSSQIQSEYIAKLITALSSGDISLFKEAQKTWVQDQNPAVETILGFVEPYRDPYGVRAEFEGLVGIVQKKETELLERLIEHTDVCITRLPWAANSTENYGRGPFEPHVIQHRNFTSLHTLAYCSTLIFPGINLPNYNDIRQEIGSKNVMITNGINGSPMSGDTKALHIRPEESEQFLSHRKQTYYFWVVFHELYGHGTGKFLAETEPGVFNFDINDPPINPVTGKPVESWYLPNQTWTGLFGDIATTVDECRAECIGAYLLSDNDLLAICGFTDVTHVTASDLEFNMYLQLAVAGLRSLENYDDAEQKWGQAHSRGHFAMFRALLKNGGDFMTVQHVSSSGSLYVSVDRERIATHGKPALADLALRLHMFRSTADVEGCRRFFKDLTEVKAIHMEWRRIVLATKPSKRLFVQPNTILEGDRVSLRTYDATLEGMIQSWAERNV